MAPRIRFVNHQHRTQNLELGPERVVRRPRSRGNTRLHTLTQPLSFSASQQARGVPLPRLNTLVRPPLLLSLSAFRLLSRREAPRFPCFSASQLARSARLILLGLFLAGRVFAFDFDAAWGRVDQAVAQGHPSTAIRELTEIEKEAVSLREWAQAIRCSAVRILVSLDLEKTKMEELLPVFSDFAEVAPEPMRPGLQLLVAHLYWTYYRENHWRFLHRSASSGDAERDPAAWSRERILAEIESRFKRVLAFETELQQVPVETYAPLLQSGALPDACRPTLYDFAVYDMLDFYRQTAYARPADTRWTLKPSGACFASAEKFQQFVPDSLSAESVLFRGIRLLQNLLRFHEKDTDRTAFADADLARLQFCYEFGTGPRGAKQYADALDQFMSRNRAMEVSVRAAALRAELACGGGQDFGLAHLIASRAVARFPESVGGVACRKLIERLETPSFSVLTEESWCEPWTELTVLYRNLSDIFLRLIPLTPREVMELAPVEWARLQKPASRSWTQTLPPASDYKEHRFSVPIPKGIAPGLYALIASDDPTFEKNGTGVAVRLIHAGDLAVVTRTDQPSGFVLRATDGMPVAEATVQLWEASSGAKKSWRAVSETTSDENGAFDLGSFRKDGRIVAWTTDGRCAFAPFESSWRREKRKTAGEQVALFADRAAYRPGETVSFSGVCYVSNPDKDQFHVLSNRTVSVSLTNPKGKGIASLKLESDAYGVIHGAFQLPEKEVGTFSLRVEKQSVAIPVTESAGEKFAVRLRVAQNEIRFGDQVLAEGIAETAGKLPLADAKVAWRVMVGKCGAAPGGEQVIASGEIITDSRGHFPILFTAETDADGKLGEKDVYRYRVVAEVTDRSGETHSADWSCRVASAMWESDVTVDEYTLSDRPVSFRVAVRQLNGGGVGTKGRLRIFTVRTPTRVHRDPLLTDEERLVVPDLAEEDAASRDWEMWKEQDEIASQQIATDANGLAKGSVQLPPGMYRFSFETSDHAGKRVAAQKTCAVFDKAAKRMAFPVSDVLAVEKRELAPGDTLRFFWGTGYQDARFYTALLKDGAKLFERFNTPGCSQECFEFPIDDAMCGELFLVTCFVRENRIYTRRERISVPYRNRRLSLRWERFSSRLAAEEEVDWAIRVSDANGAPVAASVTATMYDRSLDAASPLAWPRFQTPFAAEETKRAAESVRFSFGNGRASLENTWKRESREEPEESDTPRYRQWRREIVPRWEDASFGGVRSRLLRTRLLRKGGAAKPEPTPTGVSPLHLATAARSRVPLPEPSSSVLPVGRSTRQTACFFPAVQTDTNGVATLSFKAPKRLTAWHLRLFAHDSQLRFAELDDASIVTRRELSVQGLPPRFVREQDHLFFSARVTHDSENARHGMARLFVEVRGADGEVRSETLLAPAVQKFRLDAQGTAQVEWHLQIPDGATGITYRVTAETTDRFRDSEEGVIPVLSRQVTVRESFPLPAAGEESRRCEFMPLVASLESPTLRHSGLTVQGVVSPVKYAMRSLADLLDAPCESAEELFARAFAAAVCEADAKRSGTNALSRADTLRLVRIREESMRGLAGLQVSGGLWPWLSGGEENLDVSLSILSGLVRLQRLTGEKYPILRSALPQLDRKMREVTQSRGRRGDETRPFTEAMYLYVRASSLADVPMDAEQKQYWERMLAEARETWKEMEVVDRTLVALAFHRMGDRELPPLILQSFADAVRTRLPDLNISCVPVARMLEAYLELARDGGAWKECLTWLLLHRGESGWGSARETVEAAAAILLTGQRTDSGSLPLPELKLGARNVTWRDAENNGVSEERIPASEVSSEMGNITLRGRNNGASAPAMIHWNYRENPESIHRDGKPLFYLRKRFGIRDRVTGDLMPVRDVLEPGTEVVVCLDFESVTSLRYVRLHDDLPGGVRCEELPGIRRQNGLTYEQRVHETDTEFYFENLPSGAFRIDYTCRADQCGQFQGGNTWIECAARLETRVYNSDAAQLPNLLIDRKQ